MMNNPPSLQSSRVDYFLFLPDSNEMTNVPKSSINVNASNTVT
ncbi:hypothetical protein [Bacillus solitudinis]|nr:hypothetical protein [Bacillus solitudinis]